MECLVRDHRVRVKQPTRQNLRTAAAPILVVSLLVIAGCQEASSLPAGEARPPFLDRLAHMKVGDDPLPPGEPMPELVAEGWINGQPPELGRRIVVLEAWAWW